MKNWSGHIVFNESFHWKDLEKYFPDMYYAVEEKTKVNQEEKQFDDVMLELNMEEILKDRRPFGYRRENAKFKMIIPQNKNEITIFHGTPSDEIEDVTEEVAACIKSKKIHFNIEYDRMVLIKITEERS
ncbi:hypothetical protein [Picrophilus oshimae]|uniref:Uncharacterized protein n=1 Tax=Picrophilus torridus (strain ATCC 700027 / DSM 9790 / JCM 10055 / NBRC 100828 / KAW 2/3) TaxID=1122961 RepID=Q6L173_PICTO|nr:hypothetical protein [Picrophilus oshimae]AAT43279.1 hypothetical protein PTO0694 [Picrophilus oshimae DSM 9789]SMD30414.1 hypothetical protein SAMN02745355_0294 [Picrophilus oshimae DSM 9789]